MFPSNARTPSSPILRGKCWGGGKGQDQRSGIVCLTGEPARPRAGCSTAARGRAGSPDRVVLFPGEKDHHQRVGDEMIWLPAAAAEASPAGCAFFFFAGGV